MASASPPVRVWPLPPPGRAPLVEVYPARNMNRLLPSALMVCWMAYCAPCPMDIISTTAPTPITMPSMVSKVRSLFAPIARQASPSIAKIMRKPHLNHEEHEGHEEKLHVALTNENCLAGEYLASCNRMNRGWQGYRPWTITRKNLRVLRVLRGELFLPCSCRHLQMRRGLVADDAAVMEAHLALRVMRDVRLVGDQQDGD